MYGSEFVTWRLQGERESPTDILLRLKQEKQQIKLKIEHLQQREKEVTQRIGKIIQVIAGDDFTIEAK